MYNVNELYEYVNPSVWRKSDRTFKKKYTRDLIKLCIDIIFEVAALIDGSCYCAF